MIVLNEVKVKYEVLDELLKEQLQDIRFSTNVNVIIDVKEVVKKFFRKDLFPTIGTHEMIIQEIVADMVNIIGHYRNYFFKQGKYSTFYCLYSKKENSTFKEIYPEYKRYHYEKYFTDPEESEKIALVKKSMVAFEKIVNSVPNSFFIDTSEFDEMIVAKHIISRTLPNELNVILSDDELMFQLLNEHTFILNLKGVLTKILDSKNAVSILIKRESELSSNMIPLLLTMSGVKRYSLNGIPNVALLKSESMIKSLIKRGVIMDSEYFKFPIEVEKLDPANKMDLRLLENYDQLSRDYSIITGNDILYSNELRISQLLNGHKKVGSKSYFLELNSKIFNTFPIQLDMLMKGETLK